MKEMMHKVYPILLPPVVLIAGILGVIFFFLGPVGKGNYDILAIGIVAIALALFAILLVLIEVIKNKGKNNKK